MIKQPRHSEKNCAVCGQKIPEARLEAMPGTTYCVKCAEIKVKHKQADILSASDTCRNGFAPNS